MGSDLFRPMLSMSVADRLCSSLIVDKAYDGKVSEKTV
jgi:hypothetical protein